MIDVRSSRILVFTAGPVQAQVGGGASPGGSMGGKSGNLGESKGSMNQNRTHGREPSGPMGEGRREMTRPGQSVESEATQLFPGEAVQDLAAWGHPVERAPVEGRDHLEAPDGRRIPPIGGYKGVG